MTASGSTRLTLRLHRTELVLVGLLVIVGTIASVALAARLDVLRPPAACRSGVDLAPNQQSACELAGRAFYDLAGALSGPISALLLAGAWIGALVLGIPIVARELERGTTRLAWAMSPSRIRWLAARLLPVLVVLAVVTYVAGLALDRLVGAGAIPTTDLSRSFNGFGFRGLLIASRAVFIFAVAVATGAVVGRTLPALIVAAVVVVAGLVGGERVNQEILKSEAIVVDVDQATPGDYFVDQKFRLPDGRLVGWDQIEQFDPQPQPDVNGNFPPDADTWPHEPMVSIVVPGERYRFVETREAAALGGGSFVALSIAAFAVNRRRPE